MIHVCQGHEKGIGTEVFLKSLLRLPAKVAEAIVFHVSKEVLEENLDYLNTKANLKGNKLTLFNSVININFTEKNNPSDMLSTLSLISAMESCKDSDILITLPTSKDQLVQEGVMCAGYTHFFRQYFKKSEISMVFKGPRDLTLLLTDHIPLNSVSSRITSELINTKIALVLNEFPKYFHSIDEVLLSGINPHAGEDGILGEEEVNLFNAINFHELKVKGMGFLPGDTLHFHRDPSKKQLLCYMHHDQALATFKDRNGLLGLNISLGLPFLRLSVDHGTAFELYGKNTADCSGCYHVIKEAYKVHRHVHK